MIEGLIRIPSSLSKIVYIAFFREYTFWLRAKYYFTRKRLSWLNLFNYLSFYAINTSSYLIASFKTSIVSGRFRITSTGVDSAPHELACSHRLRNENRLCGKRCFFFCIVKSKTLIFYSNRYLIGPLGAMRTQYVDIQYHGLFVRVANF